MKHKVGIIYSCVHKKLADVVNPTKEINHKELFKIFGMVFHIPKSLRPAVLKELINLKMLVPIAQRKYRVAPCTYDPEQNRHIIYKRLEIF